MSEEIGNFHAECLQASEEELRQWLELERAKPKPDMTRVLAIKVSLRGKSYAMGAMSFGDWVEASRKIPQKETPRLSPDLLKLLEEVPEGTLALARVEKYRLHAHAHVKSARALIGTLMALCPEMKPDLMALARELNTIAAKIGNFEVKGG